MKINFKLKTLRAHLVFYQALLIVFILLVAGALSYIYISRTFVKMILIEQKSLGTSLAGSLENELDKMNIVSMNISYSNLIKDMFRDYYKYSNPMGPLTARVKKYNDQFQLFDSILAIMGHFNSVSQVNLYTFDGFMVGSGLFNEETQIDLSTIPEIQRAIELDGYKYLTTPCKNEYLVKRNLHLKDHYFLSLLRVFKSQHHQKEGIVEVLQDCEKIFISIDLQEKSKRSLRVFILNNQGDFLYPYGKKMAISSEKLLQVINGEQNLDTLNSVDFEGRSHSEIISTFKLDKYGLNLVLLQSKYVILTPLRSFQFLFLIFLVFITAYTIFVSYSVSSRVTQPLDKLVDFLSNLKLNSFSLEKYEKYTPSDNTFSEIDSLYAAFNLMSRKLKQSLNDLIELKDQEALTRLLTLQSQMNPHFLYNNLANISVLAEENKNKQVVSMCRDISFMLRYSTIKDPGGTTISEEIEYVKKYLTCMTIRYEDDLNFNIKYSDSMKDIRIPRILIQPLVENSINHGFAVEPPWEISITGEILDDKWYITVSDNGIGFPLSILEYFSKKSENKIISNHLGLENTRQRLELIYKKNAVFTLFNNYNKGASITIGGDLHYYEGKHERKI